MTLEYLYRHALDMTYIAPLANDETLRTFKPRIQNTPHTKASLTKECLEVRIKELHPDTQWMQVWKNYIRPRYRRKSHPCGTSCYMIKCRLMSACKPTGSFNRIAADTVEGETPTDTGRRNATKKRPSGCGQGKELRRCHEGTRGAYLSDCCLRPHLQFWSPQRHKVILWLLSHLVMY